MHSSDNPLCLHNVVYLHFHKVVFTFPHNKEFLSYSTLALMSFIFIQERLGLCFGHSKRISFILTLICLHA